jgi:hypothetical protein
VKIADTHRPALLFETHLPTRYYIPKLDVRMDLLIPTDGRGREFESRGPRHSFWSAIPSFCLAAKSNGSAFVYWVRLPCVGKDYGAADDECAA